MSERKWLSQRNRFIVAAVIVVAVFVVVSLLVSVLRDPPVTNVILATGTEGGTYTLIGTALARVMESQGQISVEARTTNGSRQNIELLLQDDEPGAHLGFVTRRTLFDLSADELSRLRVIADLHDEFVQVLVRRDFEATSLRDLSQARIYIGAERSGTELVAREILTSVGIDVTEEMRSGSQGDSFRQASQKLSDGLLEAAIIVSGAPTGAVSDALAEGDVEILDLTSDMDALRTIDQFGSKYEPLDIPGRLYDAGQDTPIATLTTRAHLISTTDLSDELATLTLSALFDNIRDLLFAHSRAHDIDFEQPEDDPLELHRGVLDFWFDQDNVLLIATGAIDGIYYTTGKLLESLLEQRDIEARTVHTDGSLENLDELLLRRNTVALMQNDVALASFWNDPTAVYGLPLEVRPATSLRRIATLHPERVHILGRRESFGGEEAPTVSSLAGMTVAIGPERSGTQLLARTILKHHDVQPLLEVNLPVRDMLNQLYSGQIDAGFLTEGDPSQALSAILEDPQFQLLSVEPEHMLTLSGAFEGAAFEPGEYGSQLPEEGIVQTIETHAVLVTRDDILFDVADITSALTDGLDFLNLDIQDTALPGTSLEIPLHPDAEDYYRSQELLPAPQPRFLGFTVEVWVDVLAAIGQMLVISAVAFGASKGLLKLRRDKTFNELGREIFEISVEATETSSVEMLISVRNEIRERVKRRWWEPGEINKERWRVLEDLVNLGIAESKENEERKFVREIGQLNQNASIDIEESAFLRDELWLQLINGDLDVAQHTRLIELLSRRRSSKARAE